MFNEQDTNTDSEWERWGSSDPYFGVLTNARFRRQNLNQDSINEFFESGAHDIHRVLERCRFHIDPSFSPARALDFGCGVGRLVVPLAKIADHVVGLDVSESMLTEARQNCERYGVGNVTLLKSNDNLSALEGLFDLVHSYIVFQHIPPERGKRIFMHLLNHLAEGGIGAIQLKYSNASVANNCGKPSTFERAKSIIKHKTKRYLKQLLKGKHKPQCKPTKGGLSVLSDPEIQMNPYNLSEIFLMLQAAGIENVCADFTDHGGELGVYLFFQKARR